MRKFFTIVYLLSIIQFALAQEEYVGTTISRNNSYSFRYLSFFNGNDENLLISPFAVSTSMAMAYIGSEGNTEQVIARNMNFITPYGVLFAFKQIIRQYQTYKTNDVNLMIGNALWVNEELELQKKYKNILKVNFASHIESVPFKNDSAENSELINRWVKKTSNYNVLNIVRPEYIDPDDQLVFTNYVYLDGNWDNPFDEQFTGKDDFYKSDTVKVKVDFMNQTSYLKYNENSIFQIVELPYSGRNLSMIVLLPKKNTDLDSIYKSLNSLDFDFWISELYTKLVSVSIPKFRIESMQDITPVISLNGCELPFTDKAEFSRISSQSVSISKIIQETTINVHENNISNLTGQLLTTDLSKVNKDNTIMKFKADKPFLFIVKDNVLNSILMIGKVVSPGFDNFSTDYNNN